MVLKFLKPQSGYVKVEAYFLSAFCIKRPSDVKCLEIFFSLKLQTHRLLKLSYYYRKVLKICISLTAWKVSVFGIFLVHIFPHSDLIYTKKTTSTDTFTQWLWCIVSAYFKCFLTHFIPLISFCTPWKHQKTSGFLILSGCIERDSDIKWVKDVFLKNEKN